MEDVLTRNQTFASPSEALKHYGKKGMKWGVRNEDKPAGDAGPSKKDVKVAELTSRAAKADIHVKELQDHIAATPPGFRGALQRNDLRNQLNQTVAYRDHLNKTADQVRQGKLTTNQKRLIVGGVIVGGLFAATALTSAQQSGQLNSLKLRGQARLQGKPFDFKKRDSFASAKSADDVLSHVVPGINPNYDVPGGQMNCRRCTFAYELRRRGYDVSATPSSLGYGQSESGFINAITPGKRNRYRAQSMSTGVATGQGIAAKVRGDFRANKAERYSHPDANDRSGFAKLLGKQPDGARGEAVFNFGGFGHSLSYERFGDKTYIFDTQKGKRYDVNDKDSYQSFIDKWGGARAVKDIQVTRLDNAELDTTFLSRWATNNKTAPPRGTTTPQKNARPAHMDPKVWERLQNSGKVVTPYSQKPANMSDELWQQLQEMNS